MGITVPSFSLNWNLIALSTYCRYVFGVTHIPRLEDWPVMPVEHIGFTLMVWNSYLLFNFSRLFTCL